MRKPILILSLFVVAFISFAQDSRWQDHFSYRNAKEVVESDDYVAVASDMGLMLFNKLTAEIKTVSRVNGISDVDITALQTIGTNKFIIGYSNGNIDVFSNDQIFNIPDFKIKQIQGTKQINHFYFHNGKVYCSTDYALLVLDVDKREISDTYFLGYNAESLKIYQTVVDGEYIYAATERGLLRAILSDPLIVYDKGWTLASLNSRANVAVSLHANEIVSVVDNGSNYTISYGNVGAWQQLKTINRFESLNVFGGKMVCSYLSQIEIFDENFVREDSIKNYTFDNNVTAQCAIFSSYEGAYFVADANYGLVKSTNDSDLSFIANGPYSNNCFDIHATSKGIYSVAGGITGIYDNLGRKVEYSYFNHQKWSSYRSSKKGNEKDWRDLIRICSDKKDDSKVYMSSWGGGIFEAVNDSVIHYGKSESGLQNIDWAGTSYVRVGGIGTDSEGNVWMSNSSVDGGIVVKSDSSWYRMNYETTDNLHSTGQFLITKDDYIWIPIPMYWLEDRRGLMVINPNGTPLDDSDDEYKSGLRSNGSDSRNKGQLRLWDEDRIEITKSVLSMAEDKNGYVWLGTDKGVLVNYRPWAIFSEDYPVTSRIKVPRNDGSNLADYLLEDERVSSIAVDGANRKWIGTENSGLYLVSEDGLKTYQTFNVDNSPLPSNTITSIAISPVSGEVFIGTAKGIVSYKAKATQGADDFNKIYAYPNPVREDFTGEITITGLMEKSLVKITNVSGKLVHETTSLGGKAYWDGTNFSGEKVKTGVYLVYVSAEDGAQSAITKILIVR